MTARHFNPETTVLVGVNTLIENSDGPRERPFYPALRLAEGAISAWSLMQRLGYQPRVVTSRGNELAVHAWLMRHFDEQCADDTLAHPDMSACAYIDDDPSVFVHHKRHAAWAPILFDRPSNQTTNAEYRLRSWHDPRLQGLLGHCACIYGSSD